MKSLMRAAGIAAPREARLVEVEIPTPGQGEVRVRVEGCGVCGSNLPLWTGRPWFQYPTPPGVPGHEPWGVVDAVGRRVSQVSVGDRVAFLAEKGFAEYALAAENEVVRLPRDGGLMPVEPIGCAVNVFERASIRAGERVAIVGVGFLGAVLTGLAARAGARVTAFSRRRFALDTARALGAERVATLDEDTTKAVAEPFDCAIEVAGEQCTLDFSSRLVNVRGRLVIAGYHQDGLRQIDLQSWNWRGIDVINAHERDPRQYVRGMARAVELVTTGVLELGPLLTHVFPLSRIQEAFDAAAARPDGFLKAVVTT